MSEPIFILGCHRSGTSVVAGLLYRACGVSMGELMPPTEDNPLGYYEALGVVDAHRDLLAQMERDWTCPPSGFRPGRLDLSALEQQVDIHKQLPGVWAMKDPRSMFLLPAWSHLGVDRVRLVAVARPPSDTILSIEKRDHIRQDRAEAIVEAHLERLAEIADRAPLPVIQFPGEGDSLIRQVRDLASALDLRWDEHAAREFFDEKLVRNRAPLRDSSPAYDKLLKRARYPKRVPTINLRSLKLESNPDLPLDTHLGVRYAQHRNQLWDMAQFSTDPEPTVVEVSLEGARPAGKSRPGVTLHQVEVRSLMSVGAALMKSRLRPHGVIAHGLLAGHSLSEAEYFFRSVYVNSDPLAELLIDVPSPRGEGLLNAIPPPIDHPRPSRVQEVAAQCGWDHIATERLSPGRSGMMFRKRVLTDHELVPVVTDLIVNLSRIDSIDTRLKSIEEQIGLRDNDPVSTETSHPADQELLDTAQKRADEAEHALRRLRNRRSVRLALAFSKPFSGIFRSIRAWKKRR